MSDAKGPIFVLGCGRSGTTLLRLMLNKHSAVAIPGETWFFPDLHADRKVVGGWPEAIWRDKLVDRISQIATFPELGISIEQLRVELDSVSRENWPAVIAVANLAFARAERKARWGDKTPGYVRHLPLLRELFPDARVLHLIRDGRDVALSFLEQSFGPNGILEAADYWRADVLRGQKDGADQFGSAYMEVRYEELVSAPEAVLGRICDFIEEPFELAMLDHARSADRYVLKKHAWHDQAKQPVNNTRVERWRNKMDEHEQATFELAAGDLLRNLGYPISNVRTFNAYRTFAADRARKALRATLLSAKVRAYRVIQG
jgi:hypothetical protein